jgi:hypothetical protein
MSLKLGSVYMSEQVYKDLKDLYSKHNMVKRSGICSRIFEEGLKLAKKGQVNFHESKPVKQTTKKKVTT